ncbi:MAG: peptidoglycan-binding protein, partial [Clostridia bacterium]|nr:peptidoglycan-binding protein [Clostridia bacterium]
MSKRCYNCFKEIGSKRVCPHCGYEQDTPSDGDHLQPGLIIAGRYMVGRERGSDDEGVIYNVFDMHTETCRRMREFFPVEHCTRGEDGGVVILDGHENAFKRELNTMKLNAQGEDGEKKYTFVSTNGTGYFIERKKKKAQEAKKPDAEEEEESPFAGKWPIIAIVAVAIVALIVLAVTLLKKPSTDITNQSTPAPLPTSAPTQEASIWEPAVSATPTPYVYEEPTKSTTISYSDWMAQPGGDSWDVLTPTPWNGPTPTPFNMWAELEKEIASQQRPTPTPMPTRTTVSARSDSQTIRELQWQLIELGWLTAQTPSGVYDADTKNAVKDFQHYMNQTRNAHLTEDGICGPKTFEYLDNYDIAFKPVEQATPAPTQSVIGKDSSPIEVHDLQLKLAALGWYTGEANGVFDYETMKAVMEFQAYVNTVTGVHYVDTTGYADENTLLLIDSMWYPRPVEPDATPTPVPSPTATADPMDETDRLELLEAPVDVVVTSENSAKVYERASTNSAVAGYVASGSVLRMIACSENWAMVANTTGATAYARWDDLALLSPQQSDEPVEDNGIGPDSDREQIRGLQSLLKEQGWLSGNADGIYGPATRSAVSAFQSYVNQSFGYERLRVTGLADADTLDTLLDGNFMNPEYAAQNPTP